MGNFSRNTFLPAKNYVAVRLQQGVPLVDADWNELEDVTRNELYDAPKAAAPNAARRGGLDVSPAGAGDDILLSPGTVVIDGIPLRVWNNVQHSTQRYATLATANADGVAAVAPIPLTQPAAARSDTVYLDVFEREVTSAEDPSLINGAIGIETCTRLKREVVLRVAEGVLAPPAPPPGHSFLKIAQLNRTAGPITAAQIVDTKPYPLPLGERQDSWSPELIGLAAWSDGGSVAGWSLETPSFPPRLCAKKSAAVQFVRGIMPVSLPDGARLTQFAVRGLRSPGATLICHLARIRREPPGSEEIAHIDVLGNVGGDIRSSVTVDAQFAIVDNSQFHYLVYALASGAAALELHAFSVRYVP